MAYKAFGQALRDWWNELLVLALANLGWLVGVLLIITAPPVTAALFYMAALAWRRQQLFMSDFAEGVRVYFWPSWRLALVSGLGLFVGVFDLAYYTQAVQGPLGTLGALVLFYMLILWLQAQGYAWALLVLRPDLGVLRLARTGLVLSARYPVYSAVLWIVLAVLAALSLFVTILIGLGGVALGALLCVHSLARLAPDLLTAEDRARQAALDAADALEEPPTPHQQRGRRE